MGFQMTRKTPDWLKQLSFVDLLVLELVIVGIVVALCAVFMMRP